MPLPRVSSSAALCVTLAILPLTLTCAGDQGLSPEAEPLIGVWDATAFSVDGFDLVADGAFILFQFFDDGGYYYAVSGDTNGFLCEVAPDCADEGDFDVRNGRIVFDPGTADEVAVSFTISGNTLTVSGTFLGNTFSATLIKSV